MSEDNNELRIGLIGLGRVATATHIPVLNLIQGVSIKACAETNTDRVNRVMDLWNIPNVFSDYHEMCSSGLIDAVYICIPPHLHYDAIMAALENNLHVLSRAAMIAS
jgi:UDP-N-acetylglucosamine 3-dehydrogenase